LDPVKFGKLVEYTHLFGNEHASQRVRYSLTPVRADGCV
jgi:hypothetical protein